MLLKVSKCDMSLLSVRDGHRREFEYVHDGRAMSLQPASPVGLWRLDELGIMHTYALVSDQGYIWMRSGKNETCRP